MKITVHAAEHIAEQAAATAGLMVLHTALHHWLATLILTAAVIIVWRVARRGSSAPQAPRVTVRSGLGGTVLLLAAAGAVVVYFATRHHGAVAVPRQLRPARRIVVQHITHVTQHLPAGNGGWIFAAVAIVAVLGFAGFINWLLRRRPAS